MSSRFDAGSIQSRVGVDDWCLFVTRQAYVIASAWLLVLLTPLPLLAQSTAETAAAEAAVRLGPVALTPRFSLREMGVDSNVLNAENDPQRDFTFTAGPGLDAWMRVGRLWVSSATTVEWLYFKKSADQRAFNAEQTLRLDLDLLHVIPHVEAGYSRSRRRPNLEIDARVEQKDTSFAAGVEFRLGARTAIDLEARRTRSEFGDGAFGGVLLAQALNRESESAGLSFQYELTPLTTFVLDAELTQDRFEFDTLRDSNSVRVVPGFLFKPFALISGEARVGVKRFDASDEQVPDFTGVVAAVNVAYTIVDTVRFTVGTSRDVEYSFEPLNPYYVSTGVELEVVRVLGLYWDVVLRGGRTALAYQALSGLSPIASAVSGRRDLSDIFGAGIGRHLGEDIRIGFEVNHVTRRSDLPGRSYSGFRTGGSITYGF